MHVAADFVLQGSVLSKLKASKTVSLLVHVGIYISFFIVLSPYLLGLTFMQGLVFSLINGAAHLIIDLITSKLKKLYWGKSEAKFFAVISFDQLSHITILIYTYLYMYPEVYAISNLMG
jgi:hypothetical protein